MINSYDQFISINENWESDLKKNAITLVSDIITPDEIEDYFLDFKDNGFQVTIDLKIGYGEGQHYRRVQRKRDVGDHNCYAFYEISVSKLNSITNDIKNTKKILEYYNSLTGSFIVACGRLSSLHDETKIIDNICNFTNGSINFGSKLKLDRKIPSGYVEVDGAKPKVRLTTTYDKIFNTIAKNKIFSIDGGNEGKSIRFSVSGEYTLRPGSDVDTILNAILRRFNNFKLKKFSGKIHGASSLPDRYEITILEK